MVSDVRWKQRFENFEKAFKVFCRRYDEYLKITDEEAYQMALIQSFEIVFELSWKVMKDFLVEGGVGKGLDFPKNIIRSAFSHRLIKDVELWIEALNKRNKTAHVYDEDIMEEVLTFIVNDFQPILRDFYSWCKKTAEAEI